MPDPTTPDDRLDPQPAETPDDSPWIEDSSAEPALDEAPLDAAALDVEARAEVAAFRENLESGSVAGSASSDADDREEVSRQLRSLRRLMTLRPPGPGIPEAVAWMLGVIGVHFVGMLVAVVAVLFLQFVNLTAGGATPSTAELQAAIMTLPETFGLELMTIEMLVFLVVAVAATHLRLGPRTAYLLGIRSLKMNHVLLICAVSIPISLMCGGFHQLTLGIWNEFFAHLPGLGFFDHLNVNESIKPLGKSAPVGLLFLVVAVAPAIGEEVIFRGIIGRGLVARHGILAGVIMTSVLFAAVHIHPAHVVALLPLAFFIHLIYLVTRSILAPMLLHLLNNSLAVVLLKITATTPALADASEPNMPWYVMVISAGIVGLVGWTLWQSRVEYRTDDDELWSPGYPSVEIPPASAGASLTMTDCPVGLHRGAIGLAGAYSLMFVVLLVLTLTGHISA
ncbi:MAG: membrane protease YdiL (CAAX protease family) [Planctomycetaceae bacterium]|jgi:membrane protease YdiL (CAAX protease family)